MAILVDFACATCGGREERWTISPPPPTAPCTQCGGPARRAWSPIRLVGRAGGSKSVDDQPQPGRANQPAGLCQRFPQIPGLCHMSPTAQRRVVATYLGDGRARDREIERQETAAHDHTPTMADAITHNHYGAPNA